MLFRMSWLMPLPMSLCTETPVAEEQNEYILIHCRTAKNCAASFDLAELSLHWLVSVDGESPLEINYRKANFIRFSAMQQANNRMELESTRTEPVTQSSARAVGEHIHSCNNAPSLFAEKKGWTRWTKGDYRRRGLIVDASSPDGLSSNHINQSTVLVFFYLLCFLHLPISFNAFRHFQCLSFSFDSL